MDDYSVPKSIHGNLILSNFINLKSKNKSNCLVMLDYIIYNHNSHEVKLAEKFANNNGILFNKRSREYTKYIIKLSSSNLYKYDEFLKKYKLSKIDNDNYQRIIE